MERIWRAGSPALFLTMILLWPTWQMGGWFSLWQAVPRVQVREVKAVLLADGGYKQILTVGDAGFSQTTDANGYGSFGWQFTNTSGQSLQNVRVVFFLDADLERDSNTFFNEYGTFLSLALSPGATPGAVAATTWEIDEPGFLFGDIAQHVETGLLDNTNAVPMGAPDDVALALGFPVGTVAANSVLSLKGLIAATNIGGLSQTDSTSQSQFYFNGYVEVAATKPTILAETITVQQGSPAANVKLATVSEQGVPKGGLLVEAIAVPAGLSITQIQNPNGTVSALVAASCTAALGAQVVPLRVTGSTGQTATANLTVQVTANTPPTLGTYAAVEMFALSSFVLRPSAPPADNGTMVSLTVTAPGFPGSITAEPATGIVRLESTQGAGTFTATVMAVDNCGLASSTTFSVVVKPRGDDCIPPNCPDWGPFPEDGLPTGERRGSVLFYPLYSSNIGAPQRENTLLNLTNVDQGRNVAVHLFFIDGATCSVADTFVCLTPAQTFSFTALDYDPGVTGYLVAVAVDRVTGCPIKFNGLMGDEYVKLESVHAANLPAQAFPALAAVPDPNCTPTSVTATLKFDGVSYAVAPRALAVNNLASPLDGNATFLVVNRIGGDLSNQAASVGRLNGLLYNDRERGFSYTLSATTCQLRGVFSDAFPRTAPRLSQVIPAGHTGWTQFFLAEEGALLGAVINASAPQRPSGFNQGHTLHMLTVTKTAQLIVPVLPPNC